MRRCAIFAEGGTEQAFIERVLLAVAGEKNIQIHKTRASGPQGERKSKTIAMHSVGNNQDYYALIRDCRGDHGVKADIREQYKSLCQQKYDLIIGIYDVFPKPVADVPRMKLSLYFGMSQKPITTLMVLSVMEVEAWFIAEDTHFQRRNAAIDKSAVVGVLGFYPSDNPAMVEDRPHPVADIQAIYGVAGETYDKRVPATLQRTIDCLDYDRIYLDVGRQVPALKTLITAVDTFLS